LKYALEFGQLDGRFDLRDEIVENEKADRHHQNPYFFYQWRNGHPVLNKGVESSSERKLSRESIKSDFSILSQKRDVDIYPEITFLAEQFGKIRLYREWTFGRYAAPRLPQKTDLPNDALESDGTNFGLIINRLKMNMAARSTLLDGLRAVYEGVEDVDVRVNGGTVQVFMIERGVVIPATRLSDGTLRYLFLLTLLCDPTPPPVICIEEPELGLHPDLLPIVADLLQKASERAQLFVTTHSPALIDALSGTPESVVVCERDERGTQLRRMDGDELKPWLEKYRLGQLWTRGDIGGGRW
jgi:predicted ATPase